MTVNQPQLQASAEGHVHRAWCVRLAIGLVLLGAALNVLYLWWHCPIDLSEDESHYWEWSRHLDWGYYSKGPLVAWIIAAATAVGRLFGFSHAIMPVVRMPAVLLGMISGLTSLALARRVLRDDRAALAVIVLGAALPPFTAGSLLITIDSPMYCCWALSVWALWRYIEVAPGGSPGLAPSRTNKSRTGLPFLYLAGLFTGLGILAKPVVIAVPLCALVAAGMSPAIRRRLATWHSAGAALLALALQTPIIWWNARHGWLMFRHIATQGALIGAPRANPIPYPLRPLARLGAYIGIQAGLLLVILFVLLILAVLWALRERRRCHASGGTGAPPESCCPIAHERALSFLLAFSLPLWFFYAALSLWTNVEPNWPIASYFSGLILLAGFIVRHWRAVPAAAALRAWVTAAVISGIVATPLVQHTEWFYPLVQRMGQGDFHRYESWLRKDPAFRVHGLEARALVLDGLLAQMEHDTGRRPLIFTGDYQLSSSLAFYLPGQPLVHCIMSRVGRRMNQYDVWPDLNERAADGTLVHQGENAVLVGAIDPVPFAQVIVPAFKRVDPPEHLPVYDQNGRQIRDLVVWRCYDFQGLSMPAATQAY